MQPLSSSQMQCGTSSMLYIEVRKDTLIDTLTDTLIDTLTDTLTDTLIDTLTDTLIDTLIDTLCTAVVRVTYFLFTPNLEEPGSTGDLHMVLCVYEHLEPYQICIIP